MQDPGPYPSSAGLFVNLESDNWNKYGLDCSQRNSSLQALGLWFPDYALQQSPWTNYDYAGATLGYHHG